MTSEKFGVLPNPIRPISEITGIVCDSDIDMDAVTHAIVKAWGLELVPTRTT